MKSKALGFGLLLFVCLNLKSQLIINEVMASNASSYINTDDYNFSDWVELYNSGNTNVSTNQYYLTDDKNWLTKWRAPYTSLSAGGYLLIYCDAKNSGYHSNFSLSSDGETIYLVSVSGREIIDSIKYNNQFTDISYGRVSPGSASWKYCITPTPGAANSTVDAVERTNKPLFSMGPGVISSGTSVSLYSFGTDISIRYTSNGSEPKSNSSLYSSPLNLTQTTVLKAKSFQTDYLPSNSKASTYFVNEHNFTLPVISLSFNPEYFWDNTIGIYIEGTNGIDGRCASGPVNWNQEWERSAYLEYFDKDGVQQLSQQVGVKVSGGCSRTQGQKSLSVYARGKYGNTDFDYPLYSSKQHIEKYKSFLIRNSGNDWNTTMFRDAFMQSLVINTMDLDYQAFQPAIIYFNGEYWGLMNIREKTDEDYFYSNYNLSDDSIDYLEGEGWPIRGSSTEYNTLVSFLQNNSLSSGSNYDWVVSQIDLEEYINYMIFQIYISNTDWPGNNIKYWKKKDGKWRWVVYDTDFGWGMYGHEYNHETFHFVTEPNGQGWPNPAWSTLMFRRMLENDNFKNRFVSAFFTHMYSTFNPDRCNKYIDSISALIDYEMTFHKELFGGTHDDWVNDVNVLRTWAADRFAFMPGYTRDFFGLSGPMVNISLDNDGNSGKVKLNDAIIDEYPFSLTTYAELPLKLEAVPEEGFQFVRWDYASGVVPVDFILMGDEWKYSDLDTNYPVNWKSLAFDDFSWQSGNGQLGYGDGDEATELSYGVDINNKIPTALFRKTFNTDTTGLEDITLGIIVDDGAIVYINEQEALRVNMPVGEIGFDTLSYGTPDENVINYYTIDKEYLVQGDNIVAVEVHQINVTSSDLSFDLSMSANRIGTGNEVSGVYSAEQIIESDTGFSLSVKPVFEEIEPVDGIYINEIAEASKYCIDNVGKKSGFIELYNSNSHDVNIGGLYLTDKPENPKRYNIPDGSVIPANGFYTFYADGQQTEGPLHTTFKLDNNGETIGLVQKTGNEFVYIDSVKYPLLQADYSYGRYTDGSSNRRFMAWPTPNAPNSIEDPPIDTTESVLSLANINMRLYPNPSNGRLVIQVDNEDNLIYTFDITDMSSKTIYPRVWLNSAYNEINLTSVDQGMYFVRVFNKNQLIKVEKLVIIK